MGVDDIIRELVSIRAFQSAPVIADGRTRAMLPEDYEHIWVSIRARHR